MYEYKAKLVKVVDGDTIDIDIDLGFHLCIRQRCRLRGVDCPEKKGATKEAGLAAQAFTATWLGRLGTLLIRSSKPYADDKYGRYLVEVFDPSVGNTASTSLNNALLVEGHAVPFMVED